MTRILNSIIRYGTLVFVFFIPWQARLILVPGELAGGHWEYGTQSLYVTELVLGVVVAAMVVSVVRNYGITELRKKLVEAARSRISPIGLLVLFVLWAGISILWSLDRAVALEHWVMVVEMAVLLAVLASGAIKFNHIAWAVIASAVLQSVFAIGQFFIQSIPASTLAGMAAQSADVLGASVIETANGRWLRAYGSFPHPNILGGWLVLGLILAVKKVRHTPIAYIAIACISTGLAVTFSRSAWLAFGAGFVILAARAFVRRTHSTQIVFAFAVIVAFAGILVALYPEPFKERVLGGGRLEARSYEERSSGVGEAWQLIEPRPILGVGIGNYGLGIARDVAPGRDAWYYQPVHNVPLLVWAELGIIGVLLITALLIFIAAPFFYRHPERAYSRVEGSRWLSPGIFLLPLIVILLFDHYLWSLYPGMMLFTVYLALAVRRKTSSIG